MRSSEHAEVLLRKAREDEFALEKLIGDPTSPDDILGFHAQQAVEKTLKAVLALHSVRFPFIHDLKTLVDLVRKNKISFPPELDEVKHLTPFATVFRYEYLPAEPRRALDRPWALELVRRVRAWAEGPSNVRRKAVSPPPSLRRCPLERFESSSDIDVRRPAPSVAGTASLWPTCERV
jgi:HEPN domain-containing protein